MTPPSPLASWAWAWLVPPDLSLCGRNGIYPLMNFAATRPLLLPRALSQPQEDPQKAKTPTPEPFDVETRKVKAKVGPFQMPPWGQHPLLELGRQCPFLLRSCPVDSPPTGLARPPSPAARSPAGTGETFPVPTVSAVGSPLGIELMHFVLSLDPSEQPSWGWGWGWSPVHFPGGPQTALKPRA